jgi:NADPH-dependent F420 reductase
MKIGIIGGTGGMGEGLALRWCVNHDIVIGSRDASKAYSAAEEYRKKAITYYNNINGSINGDENSKLVGYCDVIVLCIPYENSISTVAGIADNLRDGSIVLCPIVPMSKDSNGFIYLPMHEHKESAAEQVNKVLKDKNKNARVVAALHNISDVKLRKINNIIDSDVLICSDDKDAVSVVSELVKEIKNLKPLYLGPLSLSYQVESITPMLLNVAKNNGIKNPGIRIV